MFKSRLVLGVTPSSKGTAYARTITPKDGQVIDEAHNKYSSYLDRAKNKTDASNVTEKIIQFLRKNESAYHGNTVMHELLSKGTLKDFREISTMYPNIDLVIRRPIDVFFSQMKIQIGSENKVLMQDILDGKVNKNYKKDIANFVKMLFTDLITIPYEHSIDLFDHLPIEKTKVIDTTFLQANMFSGDDELHEVEDSILHSSRSQSDEIKYKMFYLNEEGKLASVTPKSLPCLQESPDITIRKVYLSKKRALSEKGLKTDDNDSLDSKKEDGEKLRSALQKLDELPNGETCGIMHALDEANKTYLKLREKALRNRQLKTSIVYNKEEQENAYLSHINYKFSVCS